MPQTSAQHEITDLPIDADAVVARAASPAAGAISAFHGVVRDNSLGRRVQYLFYEAYPPMALKEMQRLEDEVRARWTIERMAITHRIGRVEIGEASVVIVVTSPHRKPAFEACRQAIDRLKRLVPIWKREYFADGAVWVEGETKGGPR